MLNPREMVHIDSADNKSLNLKCGEYAEALTIVDTSKVIAAGAAQ
jgi:hypothetical protein